MHIHTDENVEIGKTSGEERKEEEMEKTKDETMKE